MFALCVREMGLFAAECMADSVDELSGGAFDLFVHATRFFDHKVWTAHVKCQHGGVWVKAFVIHSDTLTPDTCYDNGPP